jgi:hypothetical protein
VQDRLAGELAVDKPAGDRADLAPWRFDRPYPTPERVHTQLARERLLAPTYRCQARGVDIRDDFPTPTLGPTRTGYASDCSGIVRLGSTVAGFRPHWESTPKPSKDVPTCSTDDIRSTARAWLVGPQAGEQTSSW